ncbi:hypothetical protein GIV21_08440 [Pseudomonas syringae]|uniref:hypothetical protein n=1 Tax=Pseudomonas syringae TaxID=317 RepID=UPI002FDB1830|nr:hypothetical protein [Pseudomonas syringae]
MRTYKHEDLVSLSQETGRSLEEIKELARSSGWVLEQEARPLRGLDSSKDAVAIMKQVKQATLERLYKDDPLIRESLDMQVAVQQARLDRTTNKPSNNQYDSQGNFTGVTQSIISGPAATGKNQTDAMKAIKASVYKRLGVQE